MAVEATLLALAVAMCWWLGERATSAWLDRAASYPGAIVPAETTVRALAHRADALFCAGIVLLAVGRAISLRRGRDPLPIPLVIPAVVFACAIGLVVHHATFELGYAVRDGVRVAVVRPPSAAEFAEGFLAGSVVGAAILAAPVDASGLATRFQVPLAAVIALVFAALAIAGSGPGGSGSRINLGPIQPIEAVKPLFVALLAGYLGARAAKLRWQRQRILGLRWPRPALLGPAVAALLVIFSGLFVVGDLGPVLILALVFLGMFYLVTRASGWVAVALALVTAFVAVAAYWPGLVDVGRVATRVRMWHDPWWNGLSHGHQLGEGLWAVAAGGWWGQGLAHGYAPLVPAGKTDLVLATMIEQVGAVGALAYLMLVGAIVMSGFRVAAASRTPERVLLVAGASLLVVVQWAIIHAGTLGIVPLTGIVVPFLSAGRSSMIVFVAVVALIARLAEDGRVRAPTSELGELHASARVLAIVAASVLFVGAASTVRAAVLHQDRVSAMGIVTRLGDGTLVHRQNPRLRALAAQLHRGTIADRNGDPIALTEDGAGRRYPLGAAMGTLLGTHPSRVLLPPWALERALDVHLRGYAERDDGPRYRDFDDGGSDARLPWPDLRVFAPLLAMSADDRRARLAEMNAAIAERSVRLSIDARLQRRVADILRARVDGGRGLAAAAVVLDVNTGQVLARAQVPDYDPGDPAWQERMLAGDTAFVERLTGAYGAWPDKTGVQGMFQTGSIGKLFTALAAARQGWTVRGRACNATADLVYPCVERDAQGPLYTREGWPRPIHDYVKDRMHGQVDLVEAIAVSCNVFFGQLGLALGPEPFEALRRAGADIGYMSGRAFDAGPPGTRRLALTGFGQGAMVMNAMQAGRLVAALGAGGRYRRCPPTMELDAACSEVSLVDDPTALAPILAGMRRVMTAGTGRALRAPAGVRMYGKTGTADVRGFAGEEPFGIARAQPAAPHSWFVALAEPADTPACAIEAPGRVAIVVVVPRGGSGASSAGPAAMEIAAALTELGYLGGDP